MSDWTHPTEKIRTAAELDALVHARAFVPDVQEVINDDAGDDPDPQWVYDRLVESLAVIDALAAALSAPAPAPSVVPDAAVDAVARALADDWNPGRDPVVTAMFRDYAHTALTAALPFLTAAPSAVSDAAGLGDRIAALSARLAAVGFPACMCHPGDDDSERCLPSPQDWRAEIERAALSSTTLTATPSATREAVEAVIFEADDERVLEVHEVRSLASRLLARFTITPKEDR